VQNGAFAAIRNRDGKNNAHIAGEAAKLILRAVRKLYS